MLYYHTACPYGDKIQATGGETICCPIKDTCLVDVPPKWGMGTLFNGLAPKTPFDSKATKGPSGPQSTPFTLAAGTCAYTDPNLWLCKTVGAIATALYEYLQIIWADESC